MKILRSVLLAAIGIIAIVLGATNEFSESFYNGEIYGDKYAENVRIHLDKVDRGRPLLFILGGATLIVCAIPTDLKRKKGGEQ